MSFNKTAFFIAAVLAAMTVTSCGGHVEPEVTEDGTRVTLTESLTITDAGKYILTGKIDGGQLTINADKNADIEIVLENVEITCGTSAPIYIKEADRVTFTLAENSVNTLKNGGVYEAIDDNNIDAVIFSKADVTFAGVGTLNIEGEIGNGITSKDDLEIMGGTYNIKVGNHAIEAKDLLSVTDGTFVLDAGKDGLHAENDEDQMLGNLTVSGGTFDIKHKGDAIDAGGYLTIGGCTVNAVGDGKGIVASGNLTVESGTYNIDTIDDALHSNADLTVIDGTFTLTTDDDGIHSDNNTVIKNGKINILESYEGIEGHTVTIDGGEITLKANDDGINAAGGNDGSGLEGENDFGGRGRGGMMDTDAEAYITINGGIINVNASGDGIDSNGAFTVNGGEVYVDGPSNSGNGALDYGTTAAVSGGKFIATGAADMASGFGNTSTQCAAFVSFANTSGEISVTDKDGNVLISFTPTKNYGCAVISLPEFAVGETYTVKTGEASTELTLTDTVTGGMGGFGGMGGLGGRPQGGRPQGDQRPEGMTPPEGFEIPEGGFQRPEGMTPPEGFEIPEGGFRGGRDEQHHQLPSEETASAE